MDKQLEKCVQKLKKYVQKFEKGVQKFQKGEQNLINVSKNQCIMTRAKNAVMYLQNSTP